MEILKIEKITKRFGGLSAIEDLDLEVEESELRGIIGPNGAGKTTLFNLISGFFPPTKGNVVLKGEDISKLPVHARVQKGVARTFQLTELFKDATVYENVYTGYHRNYEVGPVRQFLHTSGARKEQKICDRKTLEILEFMGLSLLKDETVKNLSYGHQRILGVSIALATNPVLLLLDEPVAGMNAEETMMMVNLIRKVRDQGVTIILVEHDMAAVMNLCERITVLDNGKKIAEGSPEKIKNNEKVIEAYLGRQEE